jgi:hypothetical protein
MPGVSGVVAPILLCALAAGCAHRGPTDPTTYDLARPASTLVIGVSKIYGLVFIDGVDDGVSWHRDRYSSAQRASEQDGFIVIKLQPLRRGRRWAIASAALDPQLRHDHYEFPGSDEIRVFDVPPGPVAFLGGLTVQFAGSSAMLVDDPSFTRDKATAFIARRHPELQQGPLTAGRLDSLYKGDRRWW